MFSGLVDHVGTIEKMEKPGPHAVLWVRTRFPNVQLGESISVDGTCLTVAAFEEGLVRFDVSFETMDCTAFSDLVQGSEVNLERSLRVGDTLGGHWVTGHIDQSAKVLTKRPAGEYLCMAIQGVFPKNMPYLVPKGSVTVHGVSLTVNAVFSEGFEVLLVPHTLEKTNLTKLHPGERVNLEFDYVAKLVLRQVEHYVQGLTQEGST